MNQPRRDSQMAPGMGMAGMPGQLGVPPNAGFLNQGTQFQMPNGGMGAGQMQQGMNPHMMMQDGQLQGVDAGAGQLGMGVPGGQMDFGGMMLPQQQAQQQQQQQLQAQAHLQMSAQHMQNRAQVLQEAQLAQTMQLKQLLQAGRINQNQYLQQCQVIQDQYTQGMNQLHRENQNMKMKAMQMQQPTAGSLGNAQQVRAMQAQQLGLGSQSMGGALLNHQSIVGGQQGGMKMGGGGEAGSVPQQMGQRGQPSMPEGQVQGSYGGPGGGGMGGVNIQAGVMGSSHMGQQPAMPRQMGNQVQQNALRGHRQQQQQQQITLPSRLNLPVNTYLPQEMSTPQGGMAIPKPALVPGVAAASASGQRDPMSMLSKSPMMDPAADLPASATAQVQASSASASQFLAQGVPPGVLPSQQQRQQPALFDPSIVAPHLPPAASGSISQPDNIAATDMGFQSLEGLENLEDSSIWDGLFDDLGGGDEPGGRKASTKQRDKRKNLLAELESRVKNLAEDLENAEVLEKLNKEAQAACHKSMKLVASEVLESWWAGEGSSDLWEKLLAPDACFVLPVTDVRYFDPAAPRERGLQRKLQGRQAVRSDVISNRVMLQLLGQRTTKGSARLRLATKVTEWNIRNREMMCTWKATTENAVMCGGSREVVIMGMMFIKFWTSEDGKAPAVGKENQEAAEKAAAARAAAAKEGAAGSSPEDPLVGHPTVIKVQEAQLSFDIGSLKHGLKEMFKAKIHTIPQTIDEARKDNWPCILVSFEPGDEFTIRHCNGPFCALSGYKDEQLRDKSLALLYGDDAAFRKQLLEVAEGIQRACPAWLQLKLPTLNSDKLNIFAAVYPIVADQNTASASYMLWEFLAAKSCIKQSLVESMLEVAKHMLGWVQQAREDPIHEDSPLLKDFQGKLQNVVGIDHPELEEEQRTFHVMKHVWSIYQSIEMRERQMRGCSVKKQVVQTDKDVPTLGEEQRGSGSGGPHKEGAASSKAGKPPRSKAELLSSVRNQEMDLHEGADKDDTIEEKVVLHLMRTMRRFFSEARKGVILDLFFELLQSTQNEALARLTEEFIWACWTGQDDWDLSRMMADGMQFTNEQQYQKGLDLYSKMLTLQTNHMETYNRRSTVYFLLGELDKAAADIEEVLKMEPRHFGALNGLGLIRMAQKDYPRALESLYKAIQVNPWMRNEQAERNIAVCKAASSCVF
ncbi:unnamed protein product [Chrysoparadoxa australica]